MSSAAQMRQFITRSQLWTALKIGLALALASFVLSQISMSELAALWGRISIPWLLVALAAFWIAIWLNARRYWLLLNGRATFRQILALVVLQTAVGNLLATSAGAVSYIGVLRNKHGVQLSDGISSLLLSRFGDMIALMLALAVSSVFVWLQVSSLHVVVLLLLGAMLFFTLVFALVLVLRQRIVGLIETLLAVFRLDRIRPISRVVGGLRGLALQDASYLRRLMVPLLGYSLISQVSSLLLAYSTIQLFAVPLGIWQIAFVVSLMQFMTLIPIQIFGGLGISDVTSLYLYGLFGIGQGIMAPAIVSVRIVFYLMNLLLLLYFPLESRVIPARMRGSLAVRNGQPESGERL
jgi:uncharacterized membrane protein YbhN (UPF0104 family)